MILFRWIFNNEVGWLATLVAGITGTIVYFALDKENAKQNKYT